MRELVVATPEELRTLTKKERDVYEMERCEGKTREEICLELGIKETTRRVHWNRGINKIMAYRAKQITPYALSTMGTS